MHDTPTRRRRGPSGLAEAPYRHHVILRIQETAEQIHARLPSSVATVEKSPPAAGADPQTELALRRAAGREARPAAWVIASLDRPVITERPDDLRPRHRARRLARDLCPQTPPPRPQPL